MTLARQLVCAGPGDRVTEDDDGYVAVNGRGWEAEFGFAHPHVTVHWFWVSKKGGGQGTKKLLALLRCWRRYGYETVFVDEASRGDGCTGYYFWPRHGFDCTIPARVVRRLFLPTNSPVRLLSWSAEYRKLWWDRGTTLYRLRFDL